LLAATGAGKSLIIACIFRYITEVLGGRCLLVVPTVGLTTQMFSDFKDYFDASGYSVEDNVHLISAGIDKYVDKKIVISTFQSLKDVDIEWLNSFTCIMSDEGHKIQSASFKTLYDAATEVPYRLACTGTLHDTKCDVLQIQALTGPIHEIALAKDLIAAGQLVPLKIKGIAISYPEDICKAFKKVEYADEIEWLTVNAKRNNFIKNLSSKCVGTTLILFRFKQHGQTLYDIISKSNETRNVFYVDGDINADVREQIRLDGNTEDCIIIASYGTYSTGTNLPGIENIIIAHPVKSKLTYLQAIGRGLRLKFGKTHCKLFDLGDNLTYKKKVNSTYKHFGERMGLLTAEGHEFDIVNVKF
jgi:superfamily II DNA or RNA helicase